MKKIAITVPYFFNGEAKKITSLLLNDGFWRVHIRKPDATPEQVYNLLRDIPGDLYPRISIHDQFNIAKDMGVGGIHLTRRNPIPPAYWSGLISRSLHSIEEINTKHYDYAFLSPIFPSISKPGYVGNFDNKRLTDNLNENIFALGGVSPAKFDTLQALGFSGCAMLGSVWSTIIDANAFKLQFITHPVDKISIPQEVKLALDGGCRWIQLRHKNADRETILEEGREIRRLCDQYNAIFIIDDHVELVEELKADGVHLGKNDMPVKEARQALGPSKIIGATANCYDDITEATSNSADYIGLGPYRFTTTKEKLSPVIGLEGYKKIATKCIDSHLNIPIVAIGGITIDDISPILTTGINGIAISGAIINAKDPTEMTQKIIQTIQ